METERDSVQLDFRKSHSTCADVGVYRCLASNVYNENHAVSRYIWYFVRCKYYAMICYKTKLSQTILCEYIPHWCKVTYNYVSKIIINKDAVTIYMQVKSTENA